MIDIHCHILPNVDDGPDDVETSLSMARQAAKEGITHIVATPHHRNGHFYNPKSEIIRFVAALNGQIQAAQIPITILPGQETRIYGEMVEDFEGGELLALNNTDRYVFVELPANDVPGYRNRRCFNVQLKGVPPVRVHPERNRAIMEKPNRLYRLVKDGALSQVTAGSIVGRFGKKIQQLSYQLIEHALAHFIASDAHNLQSRSFHMRAAYEEVAKDFGHEIADELFEINPKQLIDGKEIYTHEASEVRRKKRFGWF